MRERSAAKMRTLRAAILFLASAAAAAPGRRPIAETDLLKFRWIADPQISPDGRQIAYVLVTVNEKERARRDHELDEELRSHLLMDETERSREPAGGHRGAQPVDDPRARPPRSASPSSVLECSLPR